MIPQITVQQLAEKLEETPPPILLDVREDWELELANLGARAAAVPMSRLASLGLAALPESLDKQAPIVVMCHHGIRSAQTAEWLMRQGFENVINLAGGIDAFAREVDPSVGTY